MDKILIFLITVIVSVTVIFAIFETDQDSKYQLKEASIIDTVVPEEEDPVLNEPCRYMVEDPFEIVPVLEDLKYDTYPLTFTYVVIVGDEVNARADPNIKGEVLETFKYGTKLNLIEVVTNLSKEENNSNNKWYHVYWESEGDMKFGFVNDSIASLRRYEFDKMYDEIYKLDDIIKSSTTRGESMAYINNYKNCKGYAPAINGKNVDANGNIRDQSAPAFLSASDKNNFIYIEDGSMVKVIGSFDKENTKIMYLKDGCHYYVPSKYVARQGAMKKVSLAVVIDRKNQNEAVFEKATEGSWSIISYTLATTGAKGEYKIETPTGYFYGIEKKPQFLYYKDGTTEIDGYAPFVVRFAGGAYIHGVPVKYKDDGGKKRDPGIRESSETLGTIPLSHKCVRNYTSHAEFIYNLFKPDETVIIVIE